ncbi:MAG TPA: MFS transporter [Intrasporangium sp.]|uniref:MFS transporter n=1 Tax=Intrasporangium sp. TaxID=1925024 RepID=UPI002D79EC05|nr:MFS transporter [Intrasporangium sp.]HET7400073.1 MFS transporter [Intrasporangium sp.]
MSRPRALPPFWVMAAALVAVAANLRVAITSVPPLLASISADLGLSHAAAGALTTLPVLCMGLFAPVASAVAHRIGAVAAVLGASVCVVLGTASRFAGDQVAVLYAGTFVAGVGIAVAGTLLPRLVKTFFPADRVGLVTGLYMLAMMGGAALSSAVSVPLAEALGSWEGALGSWTVIAVVGTVVWAPFTMRANPHHTRGETARGRLPWGAPVAWLVAAYLTLQSWCFYSTVTWLAPTYVEHGWAASSAGYLLSAFTAAQIVSGLLGPVLSDRVTDMRRLLLPSALLGIVGCVGVYAAPVAAPWLWAVLIGLGQGAAFSLALVLLVTYARTPASSGRLTGMAFLVSYGIASVGPLAMGVVRDVTGGLTPVWLILAAVGVVQVLVVTRLRPDLRKVD